MKPISWLAIALVLIGAVLTYQGIYATEKKAIVDIGSFQATVDRARVDPLMTILGLAVMAGGIVLLVRHNKKT